MTTGKIGHEALAYRDSSAATTTAVVRVEQLYPWPHESLDQILAGYPKATELCWLQEEPENMGAWPFVHHQLHRETRERFRLFHVARQESASPATGSALVHAAEQADLMTRAFA
jgi:2-oxoglutarate dehydrogenase complex dehydrogenase (E1) component-like enzyme